MQDRLFGEAVLLFQVVLTADTWREGRGEADSPEGDVDPGHLGEHFGDRAAEPADDAVLLQSEEGAGLDARQPESPRCRAA